MYSVLKTEFYNWTIALGCKLFYVITEFPIAYSICSSYDSAYIHPSYTLLFPTQGLYQGTQAGGHPGQGTRAHNYRQFRDTNHPTVQHITVDCRRKLRWSRIRMWYNTILMRQISKMEGQRKSHEEQVGG